MNSGDKMNTAQTRESLRSLYPNRFCIPSETEIKQEISKLLQGSKRDNNDNDGNEIVSDNNDLIETTNGSNQHKSWQIILEDLSKRIIQINQKISGKNSCTNLWRHIISKQHKSQINQKSRRRFYY